MTYRQIGHLEYLLRIISDSSFCRLLGPNSRSKRRCARISAVLPRSKSLGWESIEAVSTMETRIADADAVSEWWFSTDIAAIGSSSPPDIALSLCGSPSATDGTALTDVTTDAHRVAGVFAAADTMFSPLRTRWSSRSLPRVPLHAAVTGEGCTLLLAHSCRARLRRAALTPRHAAQSSRRLPRALSTKCRRCRRSPQSQHTK
jgi:hypothetical protein